MKTRYKIIIGVVIFLVVIYTGWYIYYFKLPKNPLPEKDFQWLNFSIKKKFGDYGNSEYCVVVLSCETELKTKVLTNEYECKMTRVSPIDISCEVSENYRGESFQYNCHTDVDVRCSCKYVPV